MKYKRYFLDIQNVKKINFFLITFFIENYEHWFILVDTLL